MITSVLLGVILVALISVILGQRESAQHPTIRGFFLADQRLTQPNIAHLLWATSLSLNGLFYHTWLGYRIGIYSLAVQAIWCASFIILACNANRLRELAERGTLAENIRIAYGASAGVVAACAAVFTFTALAGWEISIAGTFAQQALDVPPEAAIGIVVLLAFLTGAYTVRGGLQGNLRANVFQNWLKLFAFFVVIYVLFSASGPVGDAGNQELKVDRLKLDFSAAIIAIGGGAALAANAAFSLFWQCGDFSTWQTISASTATKRNPKLGLSLAALGILISPGLVGTLFGMSLASTPNVAEENVLPTLLSRLGDNPLLAGLLCAGLAAAMLSTLDGQFLASAMSVVWNITHRRHVIEILRSDAPDRFAESRVLVVGHVVILLTAAASSLVFLMVYLKIIGLFQIVYLAVVGQLSLVPCCIALIVKRSDGFSRGNGLVSIVAGLISGIACVILGTLDVPQVGPFAWIPSAPLATLFSGFVALVLPRPATAITPRS